MARKKCRGGACALQNLPNKSSKKRSPLQLNQPQVVPQPYQALNVPQTSQMAALNQQVQNPALQQLSPLLAQQGQPQQPVSLQGPIQGLSGFNNFNRPQSMQTGIPLPTPTAQNTALPQGQVLHRTGKQRGAIGRFFLGSRPEVFTNPNFTPYQSEALNYLLQYGLAGLQDLENNQFDFSPIGNQELERFYTQTIPSLAERFTAMGGGQRSSAFQGALGNAGRFLANDLAAQQQQYNLQQQGQEQNLITNLLNMGLSPQFSSNLNAGGAGILPGLAKGATALGKALL